MASLVLVRSRARLRELATRVALGASRWRIAPRQLVTEHLLLTMVSAAGGLSIGGGALRVLRSLNLEQLPGGSEIAMDAAMVAYTLSVAAAIGIVLGAIPGLGAYRPISRRCCAPRGGRGPADAP